MDRKADKHEVRNSGLVLEAYRNIENAPLGFTASTNSTSEVLFGTNLAEPDEKSKIRFSSGELLLFRSFSGSSTGDLTLFR